MNLGEFLVTSVILNLFQDLPGLVVYVPWKMPKQVRHDK